MFLDVNRAWTGNRGVMFGFVSLLLSQKNFFKTRRVETKVCGFLTKGFVNYLLYFCKRRTKWAYLAVIGVKKSLNNC